MQKVLSFIGFSILLNSAMANAGMGYLDVQPLSQVDSVIAPVIPSSASQTDAAVGTIIYDLGAAKFMGLDSTNTWTPMSLSGKEVTTSATADRLERATITNNGSTCAAASPASSWISSCTRNGLGDVTLTFVGSTFSDAPVCVCTHGPEATNYSDVCNIHSSASGSVRVIIHNPSIAAFRDDPFNILCQGAK